MYLYLVVYVSLFNDVMKLFTMLAKASTDI